MQASGGKQIPKGFQIGCAVIALAVIGFIVYLNINKNLANKLMGVETHSVSGDETHFDPFVQLGDIRTKLGHGAHLAKVTIKGVRSDGTIDLRQTTEPQPKATFQFFYPVDKGPVDGPPPAGSGTGAVWLQEIDVECYQIGQKRWYDASGHSSGYTNQGMDFRKPDVAAGVLPPDIGEPKAKISDFWKQAAKEGQDANGKADVDWDKNGYRFYINGTNTYLIYDSNGKLQP